MRRIPMRQLQTKPETSKAICNAEGHSGQIQPGNFGSTDASSQIKPDDTTVTTIADEPRAMIRHAFMTSQT